MTREAFVQKWLGNPTKQYNEQCRIEMREDLDKIIERHSAGAVSGVLSGAGGAVSGTGGAPDDTTLNNVLVLKPETQVRLAKQMIF